MFSIPRMSFQAQCLSLKGSKSCPAFSEAEVYKGSGNPLFANFQNVDQFDQYITSHLLSRSTDSFNREQSCNLKQTLIVPFLQSTLCATFVDMSQKIFRCNNGRSANQNDPGILSGNGRRIKVLCAKSSQATVDYLQSLITNPQICPAGIDRSKSIYHDMVLFNNFGASNDSFSCLPGQQEDLQTSANGYISFGANKNPTKNFSSNSISSIFSPLGNMPTTVISSYPSGTPQIIPNESAPHSKQEIQAPSKSLFSPVIIGAGIGIILVLLLIICALCFACKRPRYTGSKGANKFQKINPIHNSRIDRDSYCSQQNENNHIHPVAYPSMVSSVIPKSARETNSSEEIVKVIFDYVQNLGDEMTLNVGDRIVVKNRFDDGWAFGFNMTTELEGNFPLACVGPINYRASEATRTNATESWACSRRTSSLGGFTDIESRK